MSTTQRPPSKYLEQAQAKAAELKITLPDDMTEEEHLDLVRCGNIELYDLNREADKIQRERIKIREETSNRIKSDEDKKAKREQIARDRGQLEAERQRMLAPPPPDEPIEKDPEGFYQLHHEVQGLARRIWAFGAGWNPTNKAGLVQMFLKMSPGALAARAAEMRDAMASDMYSATDLSPSGLLRGYTGIVPENMRMLGSDDAFKMLGADSEDEEEDERPKKRKKRRRDHGDNGGNVMEETSHSPWGD